MLWLSPDGLGSVWEPPGPCLVRAPAATWTLLPLCLVLSSQVNPEAGGTPPTCTAGALRPSPGCRGLPVRPLGLGSVSGRVPHKTAGRLSAVGLTGPPWCPGRGGGALRAARGV